MLFRILELMHEALTNNVVVSKRYFLLSGSGSVNHALTTEICRNIYYKDPSLFKTQRVVDRCVDVLAYTFNVPRAFLNVVSISTPTRILSAACLNVPSPLDRRCQRSCGWDVCVDRFRWHNETRV